MPATLSVHTERVGIGPSAETLYRIQINAGSSGAAFGLSYALPPWPTPKLVHGSPIAVTAVRLNGSGSIRPAAVRVLPKPVLKRQEACLRERPSPFATAYWVEVPANSSSQIELRGRASYPSWPGTRYDLAFSTFEVDDYTAARIPLQTVVVPPLGKRGTHIIMRSLKAGSSVRKHVRMVPEISGQTDPPLKNARIIIRAVRPAPREGGRVSLKQWAKGGSASVSLGSVRTDKQGRFHLRSQPFPYVGRYAVLARSQAKGLIAADWNCGPFF